MNFDDTPAEAAFRLEARSWLDKNAPWHLEHALRDGGLANPTIRNPLDEAHAWQSKKAAAGWACLHWPKEYGGRGASPMQRVIWGQEEGAFAALSWLFAIGHGMCGPTVMAWASEAQKQRYLPALAAGTEIWCQLFSEPAAGSDLAGLITRAEPAAGDSDDWIVNGQKIWTSSAQMSTYGILLVRTDVNVPKHKGLTMFFVDMRSPGIDIRPIQQANGSADFNEVFLTDVRIPDAQRLGAAGQGWHVSLTTLMNERLSIGAGMSTGFEELVGYCQNIITPRGTALDDPAFRSKLADWSTRASGLKYTSMRAISAISRGEAPGPENSIGKLVAASMQQEIASFAIDLQAEAGMLTDPQTSASNARFQSMLLRAPATRVEGGTDEILRNIIAERVLGLPGDIRVDKDIPFSQIAKGAGR